jgi:hypothetical protein
VLAGVVKARLNRGTGRAAVRDCPEMGQPEPRIPPKNRLRTASKA